MASSNAALEDVANPEPGGNASNSLQAAKEAAASALPFVEWVMQRFGDIAHDLRNGQDVQALVRLQDAAGELESLCEFSKLMVDQSSDLPDPKPLRQALQDYHQRLFAVVESINPALDTLDLVEVADLIEHELLTSLGAYLELHTLISTRLETR